MSEAHPTVSALREQLETLVQARTRAESEMRRLAPTVESDPASAELVRRYEHQSGVLTSEISILRVSLRGAESRLEAT
jgi:hypothetical protein